jgi:hypothetical protein
VTPEEIRGLIGGYATGSLTEAQKKALFEAALEDQELFDELAREQEIKELVDLPGARERLIEAVSKPEPRRVPWWRQAWAMGALAAAAVGIVAMGWMLSRPPKPVEVAQVAAPPAEAPAPAAVPPVAEKKRSAAAPEARNKTAPPPAKSDEPRDEKTLKKEADVAVDAAAPAAPPPSPVERARQASQPAPSRSQQAAPQAGPELNQIRQVSPVTPFAAGRVSGGGGGGARAAASKAGPFGFEYSFAGGNLAITPSASGYLEVSAGGVAIEVGRVVRSGEAVLVAIPAAATEVNVAYSAVAPADALRKDVSKETLKDAESVMPRDAASGVVVATNPSPSPRIVVTLKVPKP